MKSISEERREAEIRLGRPVRIYSAYPLIGRGFVRHDTISHEEVERRRERAERGSIGYFFYRIKQTLLNHHA